MSGAYARTKGHSFERYIAKCFRAFGFPNAQRQLEYQINQAQGIDLSGTAEFKVQCKKTKKYVSLNTINEVNIDDRCVSIPVLIAAGDNQEPLVTIPLDAFFYLVEGREFITLKDVQNKLRAVKGQDAKA